MKKLINNILKFSLSLGLGLFLVWLAMRNLTAEDIQKMKDSFANANYPLLFAAALIGLLSNFMRALRWRLLLQPLGYHPSVPNTFYAVSIMYFGNLAFPRLGEISRCAMLARYENIPIEKSIGTMITERLVDVISLLIVGAYIFFAEYDVLADFFTKTLFAGQGGNTSWMKWVILGAGAVVALAGWLILKRFRNNPVLKSILDRVEGLMDGAKSIFKLKNTALFLFYSVAIWISYAFVTYTCFYALNETTGLDFNTALAVTFFGGIAYVATQGGIGAYPLMVQGVLTLYGIAGVIGYVFGWIVWVVQTTLVIIAGLLSLILIATTNKAKE